MTHPPPDPGFDKHSKKSLCSASENNPFIAWVLFILSVRASFKKHDAHTRTDIETHTHTPTRVQLNLNEKKKTLAATAITWEEKKKKTVAPSMREREN